jgi:LacI family transcriptional regulator
MSNIKDISALTGLSLATISRVFNNSPLVSPKTKQKVLDAAKQLDYRPNISAAALRSGKSRIIGVLVPEIKSSFFGEIINGIEKKMKNWGYNIIIAQSHESEELEKEVLESFMQLNVDGVLISIAKETANLSEIQKIVGKKTPIVFFDRMPNLDTASSVVLDDYIGARIATKHLIDEGCKNIVHIAGNLQVSIFKERKRGFEDAMTKNGLQLNSHNVIELSTDIRSNKLMIDQLLEKYPTIDGFFAHADVYGLYVLDILKNKNIQVPLQVKLVGFGNSEFTAHVTPNLTSIDQNCYQMGVLAAETLINHINSKKPIVSKQVLDPKLIIRTSSKSI